MQNNMTIENWTYCHFLLETQKAFISFGADPIAPDDLLYFATVTDLEGKELFQKSFKDLNKCLEFINLRYQDWDFIDALAPKKAEGCDSCAAH